jgi:hypothetical protein
MRAKLLVCVGMIALTASVVVVAAAKTTANGLPSYTNGYSKWPKLNAKPFSRCGPPCAHSGVKNVYASKRKVGSKYPNGTVIVKSIREAGARYVGQVAVMRKLNGRWRFVEYSRSSASGRFSVLAQGQLCVSCHVRAKSNDYVFTKKK